jgi:hypothetical protein
MRKIYLFVFLWLPFFVSFSQEGFQYTSSKKKIKIPFQMSNNLIILPLEINGVKLNFLLDSGVEKTVLFSLDQADSLKFNNVESIKIRGLGTGKTIDALQSKENTIKIKELVDKNHEIYIILDQNINFSSQLGIPVHGIIGYEFFKDYLVEINYQRKKIFVYKDRIYFPINKLKRFDEIPISLELDKPYITAFATFNSTEIKTKILVDTGGSDALWLFENKKNIQSPPKFFNDFLGTGFSGEIHGKRSRIDKFKMGKQEIILPTISFPDTLSLQHVNMVQGRNGSVGSEILKRFDLLFDYANAKMYVRKNTTFNDPFNYNMSGIEIQHNGVQWIKEEIELKTKFVNSEVSVAQVEPTNVKYQFVLKPLYEVTSVRPDSPGAIAGVKKGDVITKINGIYAFRYKLHEINLLMQSEDGKWITIEVDRNNNILKFKIQLKKIL